MTLVTKIVDSLRNSEKFEVTLRDENLLKEFREKLVIGYKTYNNVILCTLDDDDNYTIVIQDGYYFKVVTLELR